ncbi:hypothetical protein [Lacibacter sp.]|uniref:hypothetical protein n=1 Tax=Lacibacter sp. TaxID=1915409 RepID=UPI002B4B0835|nr:hypothetical protein [Lacibacter sp.]HLP37740.1 hypothetical protein [Lacibacter sp.]
MNQNPEQLARDNIDQQLRAVGWVIQNKSQINLSAATGVAVREYQTDIGPADYLLFSYWMPATATSKKICCCIFGYQLHLSTLTNRLQNNGRR